MSLSINNIQPAAGETTKPVFKGKWSKTEEGNPYYKTNTGAVAGGIMAIPAAYSWLKYSWKNIDEAKINKELTESKKFMKETGMDKQFDDMFKNLGYKNTEEAMKAGIDNMKRLKKYAIPFAIIAAGATAGCGILVDHFRNKKAKEAADTVKQVGVKNAVMQNDKIQLSTKGRAYYESNQGVKYGALLGAGCGLIESVMSAGKLKAAALINMALMAVGGLIMGKIADSTANNDARKHA